MAERLREEKPRVWSLQLFCGGSCIGKTTTGQGPWGACCEICLLSRVSSYSSYLGESRNLLNHFPAHSNENSCALGQQPRMRVANSGPSVLHHSELSLVCIWSSYSKYTSNEWRFRKKILRKKRKKKVVYWGFGGQDIYLCIFIFLSWKS